MQLANGVIPLFARVRAFAQQPSGDAASMTAQLDVAIALARRTLRDAGFSDVDIDEALFAVSAWTDEVLLAARWPGATEWQRHLLQRRYFNLSNAGVAFYQRLEQLTPEQMPVREVYYLCLGMGFSGRYAYDRDQKAFADIKQANLAMLTADDRALPAGDGQLLFPDGYGPLAADTATGSPRRVRRRWRVSRFTIAAIVFPLAFLLLLLGVYHYVVDQSVRATASQINA